MKSFREFVLSGRFNQVATEAVADAIAKTKAQDLPVEGYANTAPRLAQVSSHGTKKKVMSRAA